MFAAQIPAHMIVIGGVIAALFLVFVWKYLVPGFLFWSGLKRTIKNIQDIKTQGGADPSEAFKHDRVMTHLWAEYTESLHKQRHTNSLTAIEEVVAIRATLPAEAFFSPQTLIDSRLHVEFFKHLPGIFTGVGIIGTFLGLINGLTSFQISENPSIVRDSLDSLLHGVHEAFIVSASAIFLAMLVTLFEKFLLSVLYGQVQELCYLIDSFFEAGAGEEYLARLVNSSEESASQSKILKDSLVGELKQILSEISQQQISAAHESQQRMAEKLVDSIETGIRQPISQLVDGFGVQQQRSSESLSGALSDVLTAFLQKTEDIFGGQISGINTLQQKTIESLESTISQFGQMAASIDSAGRNATDSMADKLTEAMNAMEVRQLAMNEQMSEFVLQLHGLVAESQSETSQKLQTLLGDLGQQVATMVAALQSQANNSAELHASQQQQLSSHMASTLQSATTEMRNTMQVLSEQVSGMVGALEQRSISTSQQLAEQQSRFASATDTNVAQLAQTVEASVASVTSETAMALSRLVDLIENQQAAGAEATRSMQAAVLGMREITHSAVNKMNQSADTLFLAADEFGKAGKGVSGVLVEATGLARELSASAGSVTTAARSIETVVTDYRAAQEGMATLVGALNDTVDAARREATLSQNTLARIEGSAEKLAAAQHQADRYLDEVSRVLTETHQQFASNMRTTLGEANKQFYASLAEATSLLREGIQELDATLSGVVAPKR